MPFPLLDLEKKLHIWLYEFHPPHLVTVATLPR